ncbi:hypothetical protein Bxe_C0378 [Paraburkholderia xenovorans LB400]|uniref:Uncharacterized protein n=1 Tax=Paraburkholderia xenovorans (strain LB400) TaxID=266265 RepID=Q13I04_PARXL|nr:hypothetical protein Bxe_C0378 [Paraburkholderia xenovorans LB400]
MPPEAGRTDRGECRADREPSPREAPAPATPRSRPPGLRKQQVHLHVELAKYRLDHILALLTKTSSASSINLRAALVSLQSSVTVMKLVFQPAAGKRELLARSLHNVV